MRRSIYVILQLLSILTAVQAQAADDSEGSEQTPLCNGTFAEANGTGVFSFTPDLYTPWQNKTSELSWALTLTDVENEISILIWLDTGGLDYSSGLKLGYDVCAISLENGVRNNTHTRSQYDNGSCLRAFDADCIDSLQQQAESLAMQFVKSPTPLPNSNLTSDSLPDVCEDIAAGMAAALPPQCEAYINVTRYQPVGLALTTNYTRTGLFFGTPGPNCSVKPYALSDQTFNIVHGYASPEVNADTHEVYDSFAADYMIPIVTVFLPVADAEREYSIESATSVTRCLRILTHIQGSRVSPNPPEPVDPSIFLRRSRRRLSGGAIAGIVVGAVAGAGLLVLVLLFWRRRTRRQKNQVVEEPSNAAPDEKGPISAAAEVGDEATRHELDHRSYRIPELPDLGSNEPVELAVSADFNRGSNRP